MSTEFFLPMRVYIEDTDAGGIVYYANYLNFMERARTELFREHSLEQSRLIEAGYLFVVHSLQMRYCKPARIDDAVRVSAGLKKISAASVVFEQKVVRGDEPELLCEGTVKVACVDPQTYAPKPLSAEIIQSLKSLS